MSGILSVGEGLRGIDGTGEETPLAVRDAGPVPSFVNMRVNLSLTVAFSGGGLESDVPLAGAPSPLIVGLPSPLVPVTAFADSGCDGCDVLDLTDGGFELAAEDGFEVCCGMVDRWRGLGDMERVNGGVAPARFVGQPFFDRRWSQGSCANGPL